MRITNEVYFGWWLRAAHANGASFFFLSVYFHMARGIYCSSFLYPRHKVWFSGCVIWVLMIVTAFLGYMLPWGQMSFWGAMVITSLCSSVPLLGGDILYLIWGGFAITDSTLKRFYGLHFCLPFLILLISLAHIAFLHETGSTNPTTITIKPEGAPFLPYYVIKDYYSLLLCIIVFMFFTCFMPDFFAHTDNYVEANPMLTPTHIVPEWYFLPLYAVLRSVPNKLFGLILIILFFACIFLLPYICKSFIIRTGAFRPFYAVGVWAFFFVCYGLGWIGGLPVVSPFYEIGQLLTFLYYFLLLIIFPICGYVEKIVYIWYMTVHSINLKKLAEDKFYFSLHNISFMFMVELYIFSLWIKGMYLSFIFSVAFFPITMLFIINTIISNAQMVYNYSYELYNYYYAKADALANEINTLNNIRLLEFFDAVSVAKDNMHFFFKSAYYCVLLWIELFSLPTKDNMHFFFKSAYYCVLLWIELFSLFANKTFLLVNSKISLLKLKSFKT
jgi:ubiquinol-cytochrome c reductase cytochrome b/c1 subunit